MQGVITSYSIHYTKLYEKAVKSHSIERTIKSKEISEIFAETKKNVFEFVEGHGIDFAGDEFDAIIVFLTVQAFRNRRGFALKGYDTNIGSKSSILKLMLEIAAKEVSLSISEQKYAADYLKDFFSNEGSQGLGNKYRKSFENAVDELSGSYNFV